ncbi:MAG: LysR substrate-binding domain-containing protein [Saccharospirillaceae bacterium]|nr:LysR substrate-binding domain-containing protein [Saccharospirillaceae bacterium]
MSLRNLDLNLLPVFTALVEEQHLSRAAERLHMSQPAVSNALKRLRQRMDDELFVRTSRGLKPTPRAIALYNKVRDGLQLIEQGWQQQKSFQPATSEQTFIISTNPAVEYLATPWLMKLLRQQAPNVRLRFEPDHLSDIPQRLQDGRVDIAIDFIDYHHRGLISEELQLEDLVVIAAKDHPDFSPELTLEQFERLSHVTVSPRNQQGTPIEQLMGHQKLQRDVRLHVTSFVSIPQIVAQTDLIAVVPVRLMHEDHIQPLLQSAPLPFEYPQVPLKLIWHQSREQDQAHQWLRATLSKLVNITIQHLQREISVPN